MFICNLNLGYLSGLLDFQGISDTRPDGELAANVAETHACAENHTGNPGAHRHALLSDARSHHILPSGSIQQSSTDGWAGRRGNELGLHSQDTAHANQTNSAREEEAGRGAVDQVPEDGVREGEGEGGLGGRLPGESPLEDIRH